MWNGTAWDVLASDAHPIALNDVTDVTTSNKVLGDGDILRYDSAKGRWQAVSVNFGVDDINELDIASPLNNQILIYDGTTQKWKNSPLSLSINALTDVDVANPALYNVITMGWFFLEEIHLYHLMNLKMLM